MDAEREARWEAIRGLRAELRKRPDSHWHLTRIASEYYELRQYAHAERYAAKALKLMPECPLAQWDYACAIAMRGREARAIDIWKGLLNQGLDRLLENECAEDSDWARSLLNDCRYRLGKSAARAGQVREAKAYLMEYLAERTAQVRGIYTEEEARRVLTSLNSLE